MKVKVARTAGFCMGVRRAVNLALDAARDEPGPIHTLGPLIHNPQVVEMLEARGLKAALEAPDTGKVVIRSHGITPALKKEIRRRGLDVFDATCPRVARVHGIVKKHHDRGFLVVVLGDPGHAEVEGITGWADGRAVIISGPRDAASLPNADRVCLVAQTTQEPERFMDTARAVRERYRDLPDECVVVADTICDSTGNRQEEVRRLSGKVEAMVVVGGRNSANTRRLAEVAEEEGLPAFLVESEADLDRGALARFRIVGLTAGASTPNWMIRRIYDELKGIRSRRGLVSYLEGAFKWAVLANVYVALGAAALTFAAARLQGFFPTWQDLVVSTLFVFAIHTMTLLADSRALALNVPARAKSFSRFRGYWIGASLAATAVAVTLCFTMGALPGIFMTGLATVSLLYPVRLIRGERQRVAIRSLAEVPASKDIFMAVGWAALIVVVPVLGHHAEGVRYPAAAAAFLMVGGLVFVRALLRDFRDIQADRLIGRETLPIVLGVNRTRYILYATLVGLGLMMVAATRLGLAPAFLGHLLLIPMAYAAACVPLFTRQTIVQGFGAETVIDATFLIAGLVAVLSG